MEYDWGPAIREFVLIALWTGLIRAVIVGGGVAVVILLVRRAVRLWKVGELRRLLSLKDLADTTVGIINTFIMG